MKSNKTYTVDEAKKALEYYCSYQERCHIEVENKLNAIGMIPQAQELVILHLLKENFLNEERFAKAYARGKFLIKQYGKIRIERELKQKQISPYLIKKGLQEIDDNLYQKTIKDLIEKKNYSIKEHNSYKKNKKIIDFLLRKGYEYQLIIENLTDK